MFTPLANKKNRVEELDRFDNSSVTISTSQKRGGVAVPSQDITQGNNLDGTIVVQAYPNSDYVASSANGSKQFFLFTGELDGLSTWWEMSIPVADNQLNVGGGSDYTGIDNTLGVLKGQIGVSFRQRKGGGTNQDGIILFNSGSVYDWTNPTPITLAYSVDMTNFVARCSINGETATVLQLNRSGGGATDPLMFTNLSTTANYPVIMTMGYSPNIRWSSIGSGSYSQLSYYTSSLYQDELNLITGQIYGDTINVLDKEPQIYYSIREDEKEQTTGNTITGQLNGVFAYPNKGTLTDAELAQLKTVNDVTNYDITSGSVYDSGIQNYRSRI